MVAAANPDRPDCPSSLTVVRTAEDRLQHDPHLVGASLSCEFRQGVLLLHGRLPTF